MFSWGPIIFLRIHYGLISICACINNSINADILIDILMFILTALCSRFSVVELFLRTQRSVWCRCGPRQVSEIKRL